MPRLAKPLNVLCLVRGSEKYILMYADEEKCEALKTLGRWAVNPDLAFTWVDAAVLAQRIREGLTGVIQS